LNLKEGRLGDASTRRRDLCGQWKYNNIRKELKGRTERKFYWERPEVKGGRGR